jgi:hypothetical protein
MSRTRMMVFVTVVALTLCLSGFAQVYPPGTPTPTGTAMPGTPGYTPPSGGYKANPALIGGLVGGGVAAAGGIWYFMHHRNVVQGCVGADGKTLIREKDGKRFQLDSSLTPGERVSLKAKKDESDTNSSTLQVEDVRKDYGRCEQTAKGQ